jgi:hypothetical protein
LQQQDGLSLLGLIGQIRVSVFKSDSLLFVHDVFDLLPDIFDDSPCFRVDDEKYCRICGDSENRTIDLFDIALAARAFGETPGRARWNQLADVNWDDKINLKDIGTIAKHFGEHYA